VAMYNGVTWLFMVSYVVSYALNPSSFLLAIAMLAKICQPKTRGTFFAMSNLIGSLFIVFM